MFPIFLSGFYSFELLKIYDILFGLSMMKFSFLFWKRKNNCVNCSSGWRNTKVLLYPRETIIIHTLTRRTNIKCNPGSCCCYSLCLSRWGTCVPSTLYVRYNGRYIHVSHILNPVFSITHKDHIILILIKTKINQFLFSSVNKLSPVGVCI